MLPIEIDPQWEKDVRALADKFNYGVKRRSVYLMSKAIKKMDKILDHGGGVERQDVARLVSAIKGLNPELITSYMAEKVDDVLAGGQYVAPAQQGPPRIVRDDQPFLSFGVGVSNSDSPVYLKSSEGTQRWPFGGDQASAPSGEDSGGTTENGTSGGWYDPAKAGTGGGADAWTGGGTDEWTEESLREAQAARNPQAQDMSGYEVWDPEVDGNAAESGDSAEDLMAQPVEALGLIHVRKVQYDPREMANRKCALGDGPLAGYDGTLWECTECGTIYHDACLKVQAIYTGICHICDAPLLPEE